jgi:dTDP-3-amino-3,4,6-trideoxy-alpha-D-glucose transaminase
MTAPDDIMLQAAPGLRFDRYRDQINASIQSTLKRGHFVGGPQVQQLEDDLARFLGVSHAVGCNSGTDALFLSLSALGIARGHQVIVPSLTAAGTAVAVLQTGATPRFCDVNRTTRNVDINSIKSAMTDDVKAIIVVHLHGSPVDLNPILAFAHKHGIEVIEDCAQAIGATYKGTRVGTFGSAAAFSFYPTKNLGCLGDGGAVALNDARLADKIRSMCSYEWDPKKKCTRFGVNSRLDALQAAVLSALFPYLNEGNAERVAATQIYTDALKNTQISAYRNTGQRLPSVCDRSRRSRRVDGLPVAKRDWHWRPLCHRLARGTAFSAIC